MWSNNDNNKAWEQKTQLQQMVQLVCFVMEPKSGENIFSIVFSLYFLRYYVFGENKWNNDNKYIESIIYFSNA